MPVGFDRCLSLWEAPATPCPLIDLATLKQALGITGIEQDDELNRLITTYSQAIGNYLERMLCQAPREVVYAARGVCNVASLDLPQWPIASIESVEIDGAEVDVAGYVSDDVLGYLWPVNLPRGWVIHQYALVKYTAGYDPIPFDVQDAIAQMIRQSMSYSGTGDPVVGPVKSQRIEGAITEQYFDPRTAMSSSGSESPGATVGQYYSTLDHYRSERVFVV
jgi:ABC-type amino acid transport substrate-binding protein